MKMRLLTTFFMSAFFLALYGQQPNSENGLESIVRIDKEAYEGYLKIEMSFLTDVTFPSQIDNELTKYVYGQKGSMRKWVSSYAKKTVQASRDDLRANYNTNWVFCMAYQQDRFYSYVNLQTPYIYAGDNMTNIIRCGVFDMKKKKLLEVSDIFSKQWLDEHKQLQKKTGRIFIMSDWTVVLMNKRDYVITSGMDAIGAAASAKYWLKTFNLKEMKDSLNPEFLELVDWDSTPISVAPHVYEDAKAQKIAEDLRDRIVITEVEMDKTNRK